MGFFQLKLYIPTYITPTLKTLFLKIPCLLPWNGKAGLQIKVFHRPSTPQRAQWCSFAPSLLPESCTASIHSNCWRRCRHLPASCPSSWHKPCRKNVSILPKTELYTSLQQCKSPLFSAAGPAERKWVTFTLHPGTNTPTSLPGWVALNPWAESQGVQ